MTENVDRKRLYWHSRRGMLELDLILTPFLEARFEHLDSEDRKRYEQLLAEEDQDLFKWFLGREKPEDNDLARIVGLILDYARTPKD